MLGKLKRTDEFIEMPSTISLFMEIAVKVTNSKVRTDGPYVGRGGLYKKDGGVIWEYKNAGECCLCDPPKGTLDIRKTGERRYECVCSDNPKHIFDFDFSKS